MNLLFKAQEPVDGYRVIASPENSPLRWQTFGLVDLNSIGRSYEMELGQEEAVLTLVYGQATIEVRESSGATCRYRIGMRKDPFVERPTMVYLPPFVMFKLVSESPTFRSTLHQVPVSKSEGHVILIEPGQMNPETTGVSNWRRSVTLGTAINLPIQRIIMGETMNPPGNWSNYPPHKHDEVKPPSEAVFEEVYHFYFKPAQGFGLIRLYDAPDRQDGMDEAFVVKNGDTIVVPHGYHPFTVAPGYQVCYLFSLVGEQRQYGAWSDDPEHQWIRACEPIIKALL